MIAVFSSIGRADLCRDRAIPTLPESCKNHPVKSRPYSRSGTGGTGETACRTLARGAGSCPLSRFSRRRGRLTVRVRHRAARVLRRRNDPWRGYVLMRGGGGLAGVNKTALPFNPLHSDPGPDFTGTHRSPYRARLYPNSLTLRIRGGIKHENTGIRAGTNRCSPAGIGAVRFSEVTGAERRREWGFGWGNCSRGCKTSPSFRSHVLHPPFP